MLLKALGTKGKVVPDLSWCHLTCSLVLNSIKTVVNMGSQEAGEGVDCDGGIEKIV